jgi:tripartite-type tricarboxylate transporter receptor subunit TctC
MTATPAIAALLLLGACAAAHAQGYPSQPIRIFHNYAPGGGVDVTVRVLAQKLTDSGWPQVVVENRPSAAGTLAGIATKQARPDGYTLLLADLTSHAVSVSMVADLPYDPVKDFAPITLLWTFPSILAVPAGHPAGSIAELIDHARRKPGGLSYASQGPGSGGHILGAMLQRATGAPMTHVPYRGPAPALVDLVAERVDFIYASYASLKQHVDSGKLKLLAISSKQRLKELPQLPTMTEAGYPDVYLDVWFGLVGPAGLPAAIVNAVRDKVLGVLHAPDMSGKIGQQGWLLTTSSPEELRDLIRTEIARIGPVLKEAAVGESR